VDAGPAQTNDQGGDTPILPDGEQELESVPDAVGATSAMPLPETAATPDPPADEIEPAEI
jgi:hypothetical protein